MDSKVSVHQRCTIVYSVMDAEMVVILSLVFDTNVPLAPISICVPPAWIFTIQELPSYLQNEASVKGDTLVTIYFCGFVTMSGLNLRLHSQIEVLGSIETSSVLSATSPPS